MSGLVVVKGNLLLVTEVADSISEVWVRSADLRTLGSDVVTERTDRFPVVGGVVEFPCLPGAAIMTLVAWGGVEAAIPIVVPDQPNASLATVVKAAQIADTSTRSMLEDLAAQVAADAGRAEVARANAEGALDSKADKVHTHTSAQISDASDLVVNNALVKRNASGMFNVATPTGAAQAANKGYVDGQRDTRTTPATVSTMISSAISALVGSAPQALDTVYELAAYLTDSTVANGLIQQLNGKASSSHTHTSAQISDATDAATSNRVARRDSAGRMKVSSPAVNADVANKAYVDTAVASAIGVGTLAQYNALSTADKQKPFIITNA